MDFQGDAYLEVEQALEKLKEAIPYLEITDNGLFEKENDLIERDMERARDKALRKLTRKAIEECKSHSSEWKSYRDVNVRRKLNLKRPHISNFEEETEIMNSMIDGVEGVFLDLDVDWFSQQLWKDEADKEFVAMRKKYSEHLETD